MLKTYRHLLDEIAVARDVLSRYEGQEGDLDAVYDTVEDLVAQAEKAAAKEHKRINDTDNEVLIAERQAQANQVDTGDAAPGAVAVAEKPRTSSPTPSSSGSASSGSSSSASGARK